MSAPQTPGSRAVRFWVRLWARSKSAMAGAGAGAIGDPSQGAPGGATRGEWRAVRRFAGATPFRRCGVEVPTTIPCASEGANCGCLRCRACPCTCPCRLRMPHPEPGYHAASAPPGAPCAPELPSSRAWRGAAEELAAITACEWSVPVESSPLPDPPSRGVALSTENAVDRPSDAWRGRLVGDGDGTWNDGLAVPQESSSCCLHCLLACLLELCSLCRAIPESQTSPQHPKFRRPLLLHPPHP